MCIIIIYTYIYDINIKSSSDTKSTISVQDLKELQGKDLNIPKKSKRKRSERNTVSLNL